MRSPDLTSANVCYSFTALKMFSNNPQVLLLHTIAQLVTAQLNPYLRRLIKTLNRTSHKACSLPASCQKFLPFLTATSVQGLLVTFIYLWFWSGGVDTSFSLVWPFEAGFGDLETKDGLPEPLASQFSTWNRPLPGPPELGFSTSLLVTFWAR